MRAFAHERFSREVRLSPEMVAAYAHSVGDHNPLHHDLAFAATTRFGRLIASGAHTSALLLALTAFHYSRGCNMVGLEYRVHFRRPIFADETIRLEWLVKKVRPNVRLGGDLVDLRGCVRKESGETAIGAQARILVSEEGL